jgi:hypothetical protein
MIREYGPDLLGKGTALWYLFVVTFLAMPSVIFSSK